LPPPLFLNVNFPRPSSLSPLSASPWTVRLGLASLVVDKVVPQSYGKSVGMVVDAINNAGAIDDILLAPAF
jgi:hypothetical protein